MRLRLFTLVLVFGTVFVLGVSQSVFVTPSTGILGEPTPTPFSIERSSFPIVDYTKLPPVTNNERSEKFNKSINKLSSEGPNEDVDSVSGLAF